MTILELKALLGCQRPISSIVMALFWIELDLPEHGGAEDVARLEESS